MLAQQCLKAVVAVHLRVSFMFSVACLSVRRSVPLCDSSVCVYRSQSAAAANDPNAEKSLAASQNLQELCAKGLGRSTAELVKIKQTQGLLAGPWKYVILYLMYCCVVRLRVSAIRSP